MIFGIALLLLMSVAALAWTWRRSQQRTVRGLIAINAGLHDDRPVVELLFENRVVYLTPQRARELGTAFHQAADKSDFMAMREAVS